MALDPTGSVKTAVAPASTAQRDNTLLGKDDFLKILVGQLQNMDPMSSDSNDPTQSMQQMTQFSILEQLTNMSAAQESMASSQKQSQSLALLGKTVTYTTPDGSDSQGLVQKVDFASDGTVHLMLDGGATIAPSDVAGVQ
jgi:flagellar basal-body rod modification protein FlgD